MPLLLLGCVSGSLAAADAALRLTIPDAQVASARLAAGPFGLAWREPAVAGWYHGLMPAGMADAWSAIPAQTRHLRLELRIGPERGGMPAVFGEAAALAPQLPSPAGPHEAYPHRSEAWLVAGLGPDFADAPASAMPEGMGDADAAMSLHLPSWCHLLPQPLARWSTAVCGKTGLSGLRVVAHIDGQGIRETSTLDGARLPLRPLEPGALAGLPGNPLALVAIGLDGKGVAQLVHDVLVPEQEDRELVETATGQTLEALADSCDGSIAFALVPGPAGPAWILSLPRRPAFDAMVVARVTAQAPDAADAVLTACESQPVVVDWPGLGKPMLRRIPGRWLLGTAADQLAAVGNADQPFALNALCAEAGEHSVALVYADLAACLPILAAQLPQEQQPLAQAIRAAAAHLPPLALAAERGDGGITVAGRNGLGLLVPLSAILPAALPHVAVEQAKAAQAVARQRMAALIARARSFADATSGHWPRDLDDLRAWARELGDDAFAMAGRPDLKQPFCYVAPQVSSPADQPVLVQDPACNHGRGSLVGFVNGEVRFIPGDLHWREAKRLSALPEARAVGIDAAAWATAPKTY